ncbi:YifB family Mg chelatase-like AAA ATPase [Thiomicrorhabdus lithotrophica]|uniref:YifB family Mg chelatase-like AAA ATPase n=1 Tax=Thiomicrorhabdus lithotrophica TaxID=2949997 RepID=A0ABY8CAG3_9GAMM|nr:YifB family Mg chelatase-like AAA ATPase [Thiomicrorhabdus lithotrophica]WEJ62914.1 YifB family Mg chelatase-like AAA ATPase [Thiomicrorhabdus lithotrophica]
MSLASLSTRAVLGMQSPQVTVEVHASNGLPSFSIVGLPEASVKESKERVRSALISSGFKLPPKRITVNLAPADLPKTGGRYDLPIALGILIATEQLQVTGIESYEFFGELALTGELRGIKGVIPSLLATHEQHRKIILPLENLEEASLVLQTYPELKGLLFAVSNLRDACRVLLGEMQAVSPTKSENILSNHYLEDLSDVQGQFQAKRALEISASGHHSMMMVGPPGAGKSMLASRLVTILPDLSSEEAVEVASIRSLAGQSITSSDFYQRPFIHPHHTASSAAMVGGGTTPKPGALSLAHHGILFLDELPEFNRAVLEALREPLETKSVNISRVNQHVTYPANSLLITAMNPSPSGYFPDDLMGRCKDTPDQILRYQKKISGPLLDRIDLHIEVPAVDITDLQVNKANTSEKSEDVRKRVLNTRTIQLQRQGCFNSELKVSELQDLIELDEISQALIEKAVTDLGLSARGYHRILRVARTIADMDKLQMIQSQHIAEALSYRSTSKVFM